MTEFSSCVKCGYQTAETVSICPECRGRMVNSARIRKLGWVSVILGIFLAGMMAFVIIYEVRAMLPGSDVTYTGTRSLAVVQFLLEGDIFVIGLVAIWAGRWQIQHGARNKTLFFLLIGLAVFAVMMCFVVLNITQPGQND